MAAAIGAKKRVGPLRSRLVFDRPVSLALGFVLNCFHGPRPKPAARRLERRRAQPSAKTRAAEQGTERWILHREFLVAADPIREQQLHPWLPSAPLSVRRRRHEQRAFSQTPIRHGQAT